MFISFVDKEILKLFPYIVAHEIKRLNKVK